MKPLVLATLAAQILVPAAWARPQNQVHQVAPDAPTVDRIEMVQPAPQKSAPDTTWIADWTWDGPGGVCDDSGWFTQDLRNRRLYFGSEEVYWSVSDAFDGTGVVQGNAAVLSEHDLCWPIPDGYDNDWYQGIRIPYVGMSFLTFRYLLDSESGFDFLKVEIDSACTSFERVTDEEFRTGMDAADLRTLLMSRSGLDTLGVVDSLLLQDFGAAADTHCVYIGFSSDGAYSPADGLQPSLLGAAMAVDDILLEGEWPLSEDFESTPDPRLGFLNLVDDRGVGDWARLFRHVTDNDLCVEDLTCSWLWTDDQTPTFANDPSMAFGPGGYVIRNWLENAIIGPWISLASTPNALETVISMRRFPGNFFTTSRIVFNWSVRGKKKIDNTDTPAPGDSIECISPWGHSSQNNSLSLFAWITDLRDMTHNFDPGSEEIQLRFRVRDYQWVAGAAPPTPFKPGPGPYLGRVRIGRLSLDGPDIDWGIDARYQPQDAFPTQLLAGAAGEHHEPTTDRFGPTAFSRSSDVAINGTSARLITGDSITVIVTDARGAGGVTSVDWYGVIVSGPHVGKAPPPYSLAANGFFHVGAEQCRNPNGTLVADRWFVDLDDEYFRGGDVLYSYWQASDALGGVESLPRGISGTPADVGEAEALTGGLFEVSFLPTINWDPAYLARIAADANGKLDPTPQELANSQQATCILYSQIVNTDRRSGDGNRTSFQYTLDQLGYRGSYDTYDHQGLGNTNNQLGGRATVEQAEGYSLILHDAGNAEPGSPIVPDGIDIDSEKVDQLGWFQQYLAAGLGSEAGRASLWLIGSDVMNERPIDYGFMGASWVSDDQGLTPNPTVAGEPGTHTFASGEVADFSADAFVLLGGCPVFRDYDGLGATGNGVVTHRYRSGATVGDGAIVLTSDTLASTNTVLMSFAWADIRDADGVPTDPPAETLLAQKILSGVLPNGCVGVPTDVGDDEFVEAVPAVSVLYPAVPNPFNPTTRIAFDLAREGRVTLIIFDVSGRRVRRLLDEVRRPGYAQEVVWDGRNDAGHSLSSGIYFAHWVTADAEATRKMILLK